MGALEEVNGAGDSSLGFVWRLQDEGGDATGIEAFEWDRADSAGVIVNLTVWESVESLRAFAFSGRHVKVMRRRREWFHKVAEATTALWWVPAGHRPTTAEAEDRVRPLRAAGGVAGRGQVRERAVVTT